MKDTDFNDAILYLKKSKGQNLDNDTLVVWYKILILEEKFTSEMINYAVQKLARSNNKFPDCNDIMNIIDPKQDMQIVASNDLDKHINPQSGIYSTKLARDTFSQLFNSKAEYMELTGDKKRWARRELIELYIRNKVEETRLMQIETVKNKMIGDGK